MPARVLDARGVMRAEEPRNDELSVRQVARRGDNGEREHAAGIRHGRAGGSAIRRRSTIGVDAARRLQASWSGRRPQAKAFSPRPDRR